LSSSATTQQLAQYSQVEQSIQQTGLLKDVLSRLGTNDLTAASGLIGREGEFGSSVAALSDTAPATWRWSMPGKAASVTAEIRNSNGKLVATPALPAGEKGGVLRWDGLLADGSQAGEGAYSLKIVAKDAAGAALESTVRSIGQVRDVTMREGELWLGLGGKVSLPISDLLGIAAAG
jgi:flagellar basal-body rod modification protein FlgD